MVALAAADPMVAAGRASQAEQAALTATTEQLRRIGYLLDQAVMTMRALGEVRPVVERAATLVWARVEVLDGLVFAIAISSRARRSGRRW